MGGTRSEPGERHRRERQARKNRTTRRRWDADVGAAGPHAVRGGHEERQQQEFLAAPSSPPEPGGRRGINGPRPAPTDALFTVFVHEDERTFGPAAQLRSAFAQLEIAILGASRSSTAHQDETMVPLTCEDTGTPANSPLPVRTSSSGRSPDRSRSSLR